MKKLATLEEELDSAKTGDNIVARFRTSDPVRQVVVSGTVHVGEDGTVSIFDFPAIGELFTLRNGEGIREGLKSVTVYGSD